jgi:hypothetical protein
MLETLDRGLGQRPVQSVDWTRLVAEPLQPPLQHANTLRPTAVPVALAACHVRRLPKFPAGQRSHHAVDLQAACQLEALNGRLGQWSVKPVDRTRVMTKRPQPALQRSHPCRLGGLVVTGPAGHQLSAACAGLCAIHRERGARQAQARQRDQKAGRGGSCDAQPSCRSHVVSSLSG